MTDFDPYYHWLSIPPEDQPPDHYRLLGLKTFEENTAVIENASDRQMRHVHSYQTGKYTQLSQSLMNEISRARGCLLDAGKKSAYDAQLRKNLAVAAKQLHERPLAHAPSIDCVPASPLMPKLLPRAKPMGSEASHPIHGRSSHVLHSNIRAIEAETASSLNRGIARMSAVNASASAVRRSPSPNTHHGVSARVRRFIGAGLFSFVFCVAALTGVALILGVIASEREAELSEGRARRLADVADSIAPTAIASPEDHALRKNHDSAAEDPLSLGSAAEKNSEDFSPAFSEMGEEPSPNPQHSAANPIDGVSSAIEPVEGEESFAVVLERIVRLRDELASQDWRPESASDYLSFASFAHATTMLEEQFATLQPAQQKLSRAMLDQAIESLSNAAWPSADTLAAINKLAAVNLTDSKFPGLFAYVRCILRPEDFGDAKINGQSLFAFELTGTGEIIILPIAEKRADIAAGDECLVLGTRDLHQTVQLATPTSPDPRTAAVVRAKYILIKPAGM